MVKVQLKWQKKKQVKKKLPIFASDIIYLFSFFPPKFVRTVGGFSREFFKFFIHMFCP